MDELTAVVVQKTGLPAEQVRPVVEAVVSELKRRLPEPLAAQVDGLLASPAAGDALDQAGQMLGGLFGKKS